MIPLDDTNGMPATTQDGASSQRVITGIEHGQVLLTWYACALARGVRQLKQEREAVAAVVGQRTHELAMLAARFSPSAPSVSSGPVEKKGESMATVEHRVSLVESRC